MSHELHFYVHAGDKPVKKGLLGPLKAELSDGHVAVEELKTFFHRCGHFRATDPTEHGFDENYYNKHTGTSIAFRLNTGTIHEMESRYSFPGFNYTGLSVSIEYFSPAYFAHEAAALLEAMCREFRMYVLDPQLSPLLKKCMAVTIIRSWEIGNENAVKKGLSGKALPGQEEGHPTENRLARPYMPRDMMMAWWKYMYRKEEMTRRVRETPVRVHVPEWKIIRRVGHDKLYLAMTLAEGIGYVMPPCDVFLVKRNRFSEVGAIEADVLLPKIKEFLKPWSFSGMDFNVLTSPDARRMAKVLRETQLEDLHKYEQIAPGSFIDVDLTETSNN